jgi:hypothetical protein
MDEGGDEAKKNFQDNSGAAEAKDDTSKGNTTKGDKGVKGIRGYFSLYSVYIQCEGFAKLTCAVPPDARHI